MNLEIQSQMTLIKQSKTINIYTKIKESGGDIMDFIRRIQIQCYGLQELGVLQKKMQNPQILKRK